MIRALWTAATGMNAQQLNVDVISNNLANANTTGYKAARAEFKDLLYDTIQGPDNQQYVGSPVNIQVGVGVRPSATSRDFSEGNLQQTNNPFDIAIDGKGFFVVQGLNGPLYTRDGSFKLSVNGNQAMLVTSEGYPVLDDTGNPITFDSTQKDITISSTGEISAKDDMGNIQDLGIRLGIVNFVNPDGLMAQGDNLFQETVASGQPIPDDPTNPQNKVLHGFLETSNIKVVQEMVNLITAQRAYEINSKSIQAADEMLNTANNLRR
ncbi:flagellar basal-body rod protein FlgG [Caldanaerobius fijiensis DSM 17918]|uniref:Flagellar basal-body rod protein FlgG n=1 Tax=Caldanaerobius fijiensis DSM 17918 TaxID=1121256 RepID=A0A1M4USA6_9THEO|nr:flagellar basal-body rod protein FlgG [Caldanaerobius fijiensis]SHE59612.1 flagellar basal-body rod protein FlgG [Caldanaerobius fijiensis DSM 17918]